MKGLKTRIEVVGYPGTGGFSVNGHFIGPRDGEPTPVLRVVPDLRVEE